MLTPTGKAAVSPKRWDGAPASAPDTPDTEAALKR